MNPKSANQFSFSLFDYLIFAALLIISAMIGVVFALINLFRSSSSMSNKNNAQELLVANRKMGLVPTSMSLLASFMSGITILGNPAEVYNYGTMFWWTGLAYVLVTCVTSVFFLPLFVRMADEQSNTNSSAYLVHIWKISTNFLISNFFQICSI
jgi:sodium-coupled monocarboxylate transporter 8/12